MSVRYSFVVPIFNEEETLPELHSRMVQLLDRLDGTSEVVLVNDGSRDRSLAFMHECATADPRFKVVSLSRNFGHQIAITAGLDVCSGEAVVIMDGDLQDPPEVVLEMIERWREGHDVVYAVREEREGETWFKRATAALLYRALGKLTDVEIPRDAGDFRLVDRRALAAFRQLRERHRFVRGMFSWIGFRQTGVRYRRQQRFAGETKYPVPAMLTLATEAILGFSNAPVRLALGLGFALTALAFCAGVACIALELLGARTVSGWTFLAVLVCFLGGLQLVMLGVIGEYVARIHHEVKDRPLYIVESTRGFGERSPQQRRGADDAARVDLQ